MKGVEETSIEIDGLSLDRKWTESLDKETAEMTLRREPLLTKRFNNTSQIAIVGANTCSIESLDYEYLLYLYHSLFLCSFIV